jgi:hypothetical protein
MRAVSSHYLELLIIDLVGELQKIKAFREAGAVGSIGTYAAPAFMIPNNEATRGPSTLLTPR